MKLDKDSRDTADTSVRVGDASVQASPDGLNWLITTGGLELALAMDPESGQLVLSGLRNTLYRNLPDCATPARLPLFDLGLAGAGAVWHVEAAEARQVAAGGRPAVELELILTTPGLRVSLHLLAYPGYPVLRQWIGVENTGTEPIVLGKPVLFRMAWQAGAGRSLLAPLDDRRQQPG